MTTLLSPTRVDAARDALSASWHLACVEGPDHGAVCALPSPASREPFTFGRVCSGVSDPGVSREHLVCRSGDAGVRVHDVTSANGTIVRRRWRKRRLRPRQTYLVQVGHSVDIGASRWQLRRRPRRFPVPATLAQSAAPASSAARPLRASLMPVIATIMLVFSLTFSLRRFWSIGQAQSSHPTLELIGLVIVFFALVSVWAWWRRHRQSPLHSNMRLWRDPATLLLTLAHKEQHRPRSGGHLSSSLLPLSMPVDGKKRLHTLLLDLWNDAPVTPQASHATSRAALTHFPAFYGREALLHALYCAAFASLPAGGATILCDAGASRILLRTPPVEDAVTLVCGNGERLVHLVTTSACELCGEHLASSIAHIGAAHDLSDLGGWWDYSIPAQAPASWSWAQQCFHLTDSSDDEHALPESVDAHAIGCLQTPVEPAPLGSLKACLGVGESNDEASALICVDMARQGPHAVIVGTTGSGKSVALLTWILSLAAAYPPDRVHMVLMDYKGGATFGPLLELPHVEAILTDLHPARTQRALVGVRTLLQQREHTLAEAGFSDLSQWEDAVRLGRCEQAPPPRILIACDEFTALANQHPQAFTLLMSLAAQGRSLGLHLLLATQRPDQALTAGLLANIDLRLALRCREESASHLLVGTADAAHLPRIPGRGILSDHGIVQCAWIRDVNEAVGQILRSWDYGPTVCTTESSAHTTPLWAPELPAVLSWSELPAPRPGNGLPFGLVDGITHGEHDVMRWEGGHIRFEGSRRNTADIGASVRSVAQAIATEYSLPLHVCSIDTDAWKPSAPTSLVPCDDFSSTAHLLHEAEAHGPCVIAVEDQSALIHALERGIGVALAQGLWSHLLHNARAHGITLVIGHAEQPSLWDRESGAINYRFLAAHHTHELQRTGITQTHPTEPYPGRYLLISAPDSSHSSAGASGNESYREVQIPLDLPSRPTSVTGEKHAAGEEPLEADSRDATGTSVWRVRSPRIIASSTTADATHRAGDTPWLAKGELNRTAPQGNQHSPRKARLLVGAGLDEIELPAAEHITIIADDAHSYVKALGLQPADSEKAPTLLSSNEWMQIAQSPSQVIVAFRVRDDVARALLLKAGSNDAWMMKGAQDRFSGVILHEGTLKRCVLLQEERAR